VPQLFQPKAILGTGIFAVALLLSYPGARLAAMTTPPSAGSTDEAPSTEQPATISDAVGDGMAKIRPLLDSKDWVGANKIIDDLIKGAEADSYDMEVLLNTKARIMIQQANYSGAIPPMETALGIADRHHFMSTRDTLDTLNLLAQLYYQSADDTKKSHDEQIAAFDKSVQYMRRWFKLNPKPNEDIAFFFAQLLYSEAVAKNPEHPDPDLIRQSREQVEKVLLMSVHPKDSVYGFLLATLNQEQNYTRGAEILELMLSKNPSSKTYWGDLVMFYMTLGQNTKDEAKIRKYNIRAINTIERAQALGFMKTPKDNFNLFTLYYNSNQYGMAADLLHAGLKAGTIDPSLTNWQLLASSYEQTNQEFMSIEVLKEASKQFPKNGELDFKIAQVYYGLAKNDEAFAYSMLAMEKGGLAKPLQTYEFISYLAYELHKFDDAKTAIDKAIALQKGKADHQMTVLKNAIDDAIKEQKEQEAKKAAEKTPEVSPST
jgi:tetratricopeptide (TPR) repeat protein